MLCGDGMVGPINGGLRIAEYRTLWNSGSSIDAGPPPVTMG
jgi:hypothetical protein